MSTLHYGRNTQVGAEALSADAVSSTVETQCRRLAAADCTALLTGETGVGKGYLAQWIHAHSRRSSRPMVPVNCGAIPESLIDSQLFGHARGAYTGADRSHSGLVRAASGGTLLLDEVSELPMTAQVRLLRLLEEREVMPVGYARPEQVDVRIIASTNADLQQRVREGRFRTDLFYRLNVVQLAIPPLRERVGEIEELFDTFNAEFAELYGRAELRLHDEAWEMLLRYDWPGNVRELRIVTERLHVLCPQQDISAAQLREHGQVRVQRRAASAADAASTHGLTGRMQQARLSAVRQALAECGGNVSSAARSIGVHRSTLYRWLQNAPQCA